MLGFLEFSLLFIGLNTAVDAINLKINVLHGIDFLFFAPWLAGAIYGLYQGIILAVALLALHILFNLSIAIYQVASFPAQAVAVFLGNTMGLGGFWISVLLFFVVSSIIVFLLRGFGGRFLMFLIVAIVFNYLLIFIIPYLV
jgi:hypothetical protein